MPYLQVQADGKVLAGVVTDDLEILSVHVEGSTFVDSYASLSLSGGIYSGKSSDHRTWLSGIDVQVGQIVEISLLPEGIPVGTWRPPLPSPPPGANRTTTYICCPTAEDESEDDEPLPRLRDGHTVRLRSASSETTTLTTCVHEQGFTLDVRWIYTRPTSADVTLGTYILENTDQFGRGRTLVKNCMTVGSSIRLEFVA